MIYHLPLPISNNPFRKGPRNHKKATRPTQGKCGQRNKQPNNKRGDYRKIGTEPQYQLARKASSISSYNFGAFSKKVGQDNQRETIKTACALSAN